MHVRVLACALYFTCSYFVLVHVAIFVYVAILFAGLPRKNSSGSPLPATQEAKQSKIIAPESNLRGSGEVPEVVVRAVLTPCWPKREN